MSFQEFGRQLVREMLEQEDNNIQIIAIFVGRFQPFHKGHYYVYEQMVKKFGKDNVFIGTSNKIELPKSPFNFEEKSMIITEMFDIPAEKIVMVKNPYNPIEILNNFDNDKTIYVTAFSKKDAERLGKPYKKDGSPSYFQKYEEGDNLKTYDEHGYFIEVPVFQQSGIDLSATDIRKSLGSLALDLQERKDIFIKLYGKFNQKVFDLITYKLLELHKEYIQIDKSLVEEFLLYNNIKDIIEESKTVNAYGGENDIIFPDDGPSTFYKYDVDFMRINDQRAKKIGHEVLKYILGPRDQTLYREKRDISPTYYPAGTKKDYPSATTAAQRYMSHISQVSQQAGYEILDFMGIDVNSINDDKIITENYYSDKELLLEGGAAGHMMHIFEDANLTFGDLKQLIVNALNGKLEQMSEKLDGQNLMVTWKNGELLAARTKSHLKNYGENSLTIDDINNKFQGRGEIQNAFVYAMKDLQSALSKIPENELNKIFMNGKRYLNLEILYVGTTNIITYNINSLVFHGIVEYDEDGNAVEFSDKYARIVSNLISKYGANKQSVFNIQAPTDLKYLPIKDFDKKQKYYIKKIEDIQNEYNIHDKETLSTYYDIIWSDFIAEKAKEFKYDIDGPTLSNLVRRWSKGDKSYSMKDMKNDIKNEEFLKWAVDFDKNEYKKKVDEIVQPLEYLFMELTADILFNIEGLVSAKDEKSLSSLNKELKNTIKQIQSSQEDYDTYKFKRELEKLNAIGLEKILPTEGIVFKYKGKTYKLTGLFTPIHRILAMIKYGQ